jgi:alcohol dehydrogenase
VAAGETVVVIGCGGVGLSAIMIARALGATVVAVDISAAALARARELGAEVVIDSSGLSPEAIADRVRGAVDGGVDVSVDALGREEAVIAAVLSLGLQGRHVQVGLLEEDPRIPMSAVIAGELTLRGSHGMAASAYPELIEMVVSGALRPGDLITRRIGLDEVPDAIAEMAEGRAPSGITVIDVGPPERPAAEFG